MLALATLLSWKGPKPLAGVVGLSGYQILDPTNIDMDLIRKTPIFLYHGGKDPGVTLPNAMTTYRFLREEVYPKDTEHVKNFTFIIEQNLAHALSLGEMEVMKKWLAR